MLGNWEMFLFLCKGLGYWKNNKVEQLDNLFLEPNLILLIFVISHWLLNWMKASGREPKGQVPRGDEAPSLLAWSRPCQGRRALGALPVPVHQRLSHVSKSTALPFPTPGRLCVQSASSNSVSVGFKRIFCLLICTPSPFFKDGFKPRCLQEWGQNEYIHRGIQKIQFRGKCNNFWWEGKRQDASYISYSRYNFLIKSGNKAACSFCFYCINSWGS